MWHVMTCAQCPFWVCSICVCSKPWWITWLCTNVGYGAMWAKPAISRSSLGWYMVLSLQPDRFGNGWMHLELMLYFTLLGGQVLSTLYTWYSSFPFITHYLFNIPTQWGGCSLVLKIHPGLHHDWSELSPRWSCCGPKISGPENHQIVWSCCGPGRALVLLRLYNSVGRRETNQQICDSLRIISTMEVVTFPSHGKIKSAKPWTQKPWGAWTHKSPKANPQKEIHEPDNL